MNIVKPAWHWKEQPQPWDKNKYTSIALHHMAHPTADIWEVERWHLENGWRGIGYGFWVGFDGTIYEGRGFCLNAGVENQNDHIVSIGFQGDYEHQTSMPDAQFNAGIDIINYVRQNCPNIQFIGGHGDFMTTSCPGRYFPKVEMKTLAKRKETVWMDWKTIVQKVANSPDAWENAINTAVAAAQADGNLGDLEIFKFLPTLIEKIYNARG